MKYIKVASIDGEFDPSVYLEKLPTFASDLPPGACRFATDPEHYDFYGERCVKDLKIEQLQFGDNGKWLEIFFRHNCWKHEDDLTVRYQGVTGVTMGFAIDGPPLAHPDVELDEILPHESGCSHEIVCWSGTVRVTARDLTAAWVKAECPDKPSTHC